MATWTKIERPTEDGRIVSMQAPVIVSASRSTDYPNYNLLHTYYAMSIDDKEQQTDTIVQEKANQIWAMAEI